MNEPRPITPLTGGHPIRDDHEALNERVRAAARPAVNQLTLTIVARTLRTVATQFMDDRGLMDLAEEVEAQSADPWDCCPVCQETTCDDGCPLAEVRAR